MKNYIIIQDAKAIDYSKDFVALPKSYPGDEYYNREDVKAINEAVFKALDTLNEKTGVAKAIAEHESVIIKPNLVNVFHDSGYFDKNGKTDFPETTDPRVFDALCQWVYGYNKNITIAESSGKPFPTTASFKITGYDKIAKKYNANLVALERRPVVRYMLPKAEVMKEILIPDTFDDVVKGKAFYISVPKMKTNIYTGVTLSFKNAMGTIPYYLRERNHTHDINKKLADMLFLFKPDMVLIDGIIGGEGNTPAPVDPVDMHMIVASNDSVEADRITTYMMGFEPSDIKLMNEVDKRGFNNPDVEIIGEVRRKKFRPSCPSLMEGEISEKYPNILMLAGHVLSDSPKPQSLDEVDGKMAYKIEQSCVGGCLSSVAMGYAAATYGNVYEKAKNRALLVIAGPGIEIDGVKYWFDKTGKAWTFEEIRNDSRKKLVFGKCAGKEVQSLGNWAINSCCDPAECLSAASSSIGIVTDQLNPVKNKSLVMKAVPGLVGTFFARRKWIKQGQYVDVRRMHDDRIFEIPELSESDKQKDYILWPFPEMTKENKKAYIKDMFNLADSIKGIFEEKNR